MATYDSYKKVTNEQIVDGSVTEDKMGTGVRHRLCTKWLIGDACRCSAGCCCLWTAPGCTRKYNSNYGRQAAMVVVHVHVTDVIISRAQAAALITKNQLLQHQVVHIECVQAECTDV